MEITIPHRTLYDFEGRASVAEVAKSLLAQDKLIGEAMAVLEACFPHLTLEGLRVEVREVTQASPFRTYVDAIILAAYAPDLGHDVPDVLNTLFGINIPDSYDSIVSVLVLLIAVWGVDRVRAKLAPGKKEPALTAERERLLTVAADRAAVTRDQMEEAVESVLEKHKRSIMRASLDFISPAKRHKADSISVTGEKISKAAIEATPSDVDLAQYEPPTETVPHDGVLVQFRAHDLDRNKHWAATITDVSPDRKPMHLAPDIRPERLFERKSVKADVLVTSVRDQDGEYIPSLYYLEKVYDDDA